MSQFADNLASIKAALAARAAARAAIKGGELVTVKDVDGTWRVRNVNGDNLTLVKQRNGQDWQGLRHFDRARCTPVTAPSLGARP